MNMFEKQKKKKMDGTLGMGHIPFHYFLEMKKNCKQELFFINLL